MSKISRQADGQDEHTGKQANSKIAARTTLQMGWQASSKIRRQADSQRCTDRKENQIFLIYKKFRMEQLQSHI